MAHWRFWLSPSPQIFFFSYSSVSLFCNACNVVELKKIKKIKDKKIIYH